MTGLLLLLATGLLTAPIALVVGLAAQAGWEPWRLAGLALTSLLALALPLALVSNARHALWLYAPIALYAALVCGVVPSLGSWPHEGALVALLTTGGAGVAEGISGFGPYVALSAVLAAGYVVACVAVPPLLLPVRLRRGVVLAALAYGLAGWGIGKYGTLPPLFSVESLERAYPTGLGFDLWRLAAPANGNRQAHRFHAFKPVTRRQREIYVLVLGESARWGNWQVNGYARPTSPKLAAYGPERLLSFADVTAIANLTLVVWPLALSRGTVEAQAPSRDERSVVSLFKEAGFETAWLSNQNGSVDQAFEADRHEFLNRAWQSAWDAYDAALVPLLHTELARKADKTLIVLHLMGNHGDYRFRYGKRHDVFGDHARTGGIYTQADAGKLRDYYDNSVLANDDVLDAVVRAVDAEDAASLVLFMGDHGENLMDDERKLVWHGTATSSLAEVRIPFFVMPGARWRAANPAAWATLRANRTKPVIQTTLFPTLAQLAGIRYPAEEPTRSVADPAYQPPARRLTMRDDRSAVDVTTLR